MPILVTGALVCYVIYRRPEAKVTYEYRKKAALKFKLGET